MSRPFISVWWPHCFQCWMGNKLFYSKILCFWCNYFCIFRHINWYTIYYIVIIIYCVYYVKLHFILYMYTRLMGRKIWETERKGRREGERKGRKSEEKSAFPESSTHLSSINSGFIQDCHSLQIKAQVSHYFFFKNSKLVPHSVRLMKSLKSMILGTWSLTDVQNRGLSTTIHPSVSSPSKIWTLSGVVLLHGFHTTATCPDVCPGHTGVAGGSMGVMGAPTLNAKFFSSDPRRCWACHIWEKESCDHLSLSSSYHPTIFLRWDYSSLSYEQSSPF